MFEGSTASPTPVAPRACPQYQSDSGEQWDELLATNGQGLEPGAGAAPPLSSPCVSCCKDSTSRSSLCKEGLGSSWRESIQVFSASWFQKWYSWERPSFLIQTQAALATPCLVSDSRVSALPAAPALLICKRTGFWIHTHGFSDTYRATWIESTSKHRDCFVLR